ncbi:hypothetical protein [Pontibacter diazotrophicus]|uniref:hypothetical protein n=1 Tax=Pontibacter diazotrophicus TaxID=1400979 RepID=UPI0015F16A0A|nr:hypothetical protein [Pontibacter diazotrophicus]
MKTDRTITVLVLLITLLALVATATGIFSDEGPGVYEYTSIHGQVVMIYGKGLYQHMSAEVAPQGIAQDVVTLAVGIPLLLLSLLLFRKGSLKGMFLLSGTLGYFLVTYLFYMVMGMYNALFLAYVILLASSFFAFLLSLRAFRTDTIRPSFADNAPVKFAGGFLMFTALAIGALWLSIVVPPLFDGTVIPIQVEHYTTLVVQGLDLGILLPAAFVVGLLLVKKKAIGYVLAPVYLVFLSILMTALTAKVIAMALLGYNVVPVVFIIPLFNITAIVNACFMLKSIRETKNTQTGDIVVDPSGNLISTS